MLNFNISVCKRCGSKMRPANAGDYFGYCSYRCLDLSNKEAAAAAGPQAASLPVNTTLAADTASDHNRDPMSLTNTADGPIFGKKGVFE